ncbi:bifunctional 4-hydroxy-2-oxoglutarate aldolase/2-dehydro-3-deoxy-phosphogluconate aldolase [Rubinisphaera margarita]|uniref:bifunctional 4-hydroxy-2-oxoglutarate aldolase/2-dehydro-3-deoxy-phosphogluconate aldolase n=1 Tax=Rubinisphaera margarita TaxID=2909586 RepID=UPI001EE8DDCF|nr:bifunctional 4-hydroxy-2-oxoglutarate aldolase/2-dehydro-3-deoxy-phosphogluconate aldolase [Rubinisphaera margarita]MCG6156756.1 bifunctional 4-hydroxy-2-oxoglutarate aldolase/2-dehydro-3-deoxy-phosphogluconate aldolase [Rubinisphaera margarita]
MNHAEILHKLLTERIVAILRVESSELLVDLCQAIAAVGIRSLEITMTVPNALEILAEARKQLPKDVALGAGTVLDAETARMVILAGADFIVSPHTDVSIIQTAKRYGKPVAPGAFTPTEIIHAWQSGADIVKVFPSDPIGPKYLKNLRGPLPQIRLMPTGGVELDTIADFFEAGACAVGIGSALLNKQWLKDRDFGAIEAQARKFVDAAAPYRT